MVQLAVGVEWPRLAALQANFGFKLASGSLLAAFLSFQWLLALCRSQGWTRAAKPLYAAHQLAGSLAPLLFFLHSTRLGFGYLTALSLVYLGNHAAALVQPSAQGRWKSWSSSWLVTHIALSLVLVALAGYHAWTALYYE